MKLSHKVEYACRVLAQLARVYGQEKMAHIDTLAEAEQIPANYLVQILNELRNAGLISSKRGKQGGYALSRRPEQIRLDEIVRAMDGELLELNLETGGMSGPRVAEVWSEIGKQLESEVSAYTVVDLIADDAAAMYYI
ncbi:MAG: Rrf2 family transcriptional regulator [Verrucomicrobiota bacterium]